MYKPVKKALAAIGNRGRYQWMVFFIMLLLNAFVNLIMVGPTFIFMNPLFKCGTDDETLFDEGEVCDRLN